MKLYHSPAYNAASDNFDTTRKAQWIADSLRSCPMDHIELCAPEPVIKAQLCAIHDARYVNAIRTGVPRTLAESQDLAWDARLWTMACAQNGGMLAAMRTAWRDGVSGSLSSGLHHAKREHGDGFCTFNGLALAARAALDAGAHAVLILDLDAHCGGGTHSLVADDMHIWHVDVATHPFDFYAPTGHHMLDLIDDARDYLPTICARLRELERRAPKFDVCLYNAGVDVFEGCAVGGLAGITREIIAERESLVCAWCREREIPLAFALAGGYVGAALDVAGLVDLHRLTIGAAVNAMELVLER